jgi:hypothetical protein
MEKKNTKWNNWWRTGITDEAKHSNTSSNGRAIRRRTTLGNQLIRSMPQIC